MRMEQTRQFLIATVGDRRIKAERERLSGILRYVSEHADLHLEIFAQDDARRMLREKLDGAVGRFSPKVQTALLARLPVVQVEDPPVGRAKFISVDNAAVAECAFDYFRKRGLVNYAYVASNNPDEAIRSRERETAFRADAEAAGFECAVYRFPRDRATRRQASEIPALAKWLSGLPTPCAVMAYADDVALLVLDACHYAHISVPEQIQLVGVDNDIDICENTQPGITSVWPDFYEAGRRAAEILHHILLKSSRSPARHESYGIRQIVERASTIDLRGGSRIVSLANNYLRQNFRSRLSVVDLAKQLNVSRRLLDLRYREITGSTIHREWDRLRLEEARRLLADGYPVKTVFERCGFGTVVAFRKAFKSRYGVTPCWQENVMPS